MSFETFEKLPEDKRESIISTGIRAFSEKSYKDVSTDLITKECGISKGILFHYFGSKKEYYMYCLEKAMDRLTEDTGDPAGEDFYDILFQSLDGKVSRCMKYKDEMHMVNMASRDASSEVAEQKAKLFAKYTAVIRAGSLEVLQKALSVLKLKDRKQAAVTAEGLQIYVNAVMNKYLAQYLQTPDRFFENSERIKKEMKEYLDLMLYGICEEEL